MSRVESLDDYKFDIGYSLDEVELYHRRMETEREFLQFYHEQQLKKESNV